MSNTRFDLASPPKALDTSRLLYVSRSGFDTDWHSTMHTHGCIELFYCVQGIGAFVLDGNRQAVGSDDVVIVNANVEHTEFSVASNPLQYIVLGVDGFDFQFTENNGAYLVLTCRDARDELLFYLEEMLAEMKKTPAHFETVCQYLLPVLLIKLLRGRLPDMHIAPARHGNKECAAVRRYIDEHYADPLTLDFLAELMHVNKFYLVHTFNKEYGIAPINYLIDRRIRESKFMLAYTNHSISDISRLLGFSSPSYFSQSFRKLTEQSPLAYRKATQLT